MDKKRVNVMKITKRFIIVVTSVVLALYTGGVFDEGVVLVSRADLWNHVLDHYGVPLGQFCITSLYKTYLRFTVINVLVFTTKYLPTGLYLYKFLKDVCRSSRESLKIKEIELEDIILQMDGQIAIVKTKQCVREAECAECASQLQRATAKVREARARVRELVRADDALRALLEGGPARLANLIDHHTTTDDLHLMELLKDLAHDKNGLAERLNEGEECDPRDFMSMSEKSEYSSRSEAELEKDCHIKIIKVTNVYKVAYLKHYIKQKRLRRAHRQALLKKKMDNIKKLLENWQKALNLVMKDYQYMLEARGRDEMSGDAGDFRPRDSDTDTPIDEYNPTWDHAGIYKNFYQQPDITPSQEDFECQEYENYCGNYYEEIDMSVYEELEPKYSGAQCECARLPRLLEETSSQLLAVQDLTLPDHNDSNEHIIAV